MKLTPPPTPELWITNISKKAISLADLGITIYPMRSINLLDKRHYKHINENQIASSIESGSLFVKSQYVVVRKVAPNTPMKTPMPFQEDAVFPTKHRSNIEIERKTYDELIIKDDEYADEQAEIAEEDHSGKWNK